MGSRSKGGYWRGKHHVPNEWFDGKPVRRFPVPPTLIVLAKAFRFRNCRAPRRYYNRDAG